MSNTGLLDRGVVERAEALATAAHEGQLDKAGHPYIEHVGRVAGSIAPDNHIARAVAWLHDVVEDTDIPLSAIAVLFGEEIAAAVDALSRRNHEPGPDYYARVRSNPLARLVKVADIADNENPARLAQLDDVTRQRLEAKYAQAREAILFG